jgi:putative ABC transport system permease protein
MRQTPMWRRYLRFLGRNPAADVDDELEFHMAMRVEDLMRRGHSEAEARRQAEQEFGDLPRVRGELQQIGRQRQERQSRRERWEWVRQDVRFALRTLRKSPGFTTVAVLTLAVGIGASTAMFSVLNGTLLRELPLRGQDEVVVVWTQAPGGGADHLPVMYRDLAAFGEQSRTFASVAGVAYQGALEQVVRDGGRPLTLSATWVTGNFFPLLGVVPVQGRTLLPADDVPGADPVMVISHGLWQRRFGGDPAAVGQGFEWNGKRFTVVGVLPRGFEYPQGAEVWVPALAEFPATLEAQAHPSQVMVFNLVGRLAGGAGAQDAGAEFHAFLREGDAQRPPPLRGLQPVVTPLPELIVGDARPMLWAAAAAVLLLLLIACVNVANLLLIRGSARTPELAIRSALGAGKRRLVRQLLTESGVLALVGGMLGIVLAVAAVRVLVALAPPELPRREMIAIDAGVLLFALGVTAAAALISGLLPALVSAAGDLSTWLRGGQRTGSASRSARSLRHALVIGQISLAIVVVVGAGLLVRSLLLLQSVDLGFNDERLLVVQTMLPSDLLPERPAQVTLQEEMVARVGAIPEVTSAASLPRPPFAQGGWSAMYSGEGQTPELQAANPMVGFEVVGPEYFQTLEIPVLRGRAFAAQDREDAPPVAVISEAVARHTWPGEDPIGRRVKLGPPEGPGAWHTVVGVAGETRFRELTDPQPSLYLPIRQFGGPVPMSLAIRTRAEPSAVMPQLRQALQEVHPELMLAGGGPMPQLLAAPLARPRFSTLLLGTFAVVTLLLAAVGIYGAVSASVRYRTREIGVRIALGAPVEAVRRLVLRQGLWLAFWGCAVGVVGAAVGTRTLQGMLYGIEATDPLTFAVVVALILGTAALACYVPARRASRVDPMTALRAE